VTIAWDLQLTPAPIDLAQAMCEMPSAARHTAIFREIIGEKFMKVLAASTIPLLAILAATEASAQTIDVAKLTCKQFLIGDIVRRDYLALWLSGYYNGTRSDTVVTTDTVQKIADKVTTYCESNLDATLMDAIRNELGVNK
jgi:acid stress chaperone HdeB